MNIPSWTGGRGETNAEKVNKPAPPQSKTAKTPSTQRSVPRSNKFKV
jgi:hypothetical protein